MKKWTNLAMANIVALIVSLFVLIAPTEPAEATSGNGLNMAIRSDSRSLAWVRSQGFDAWHGGECYSTSGVILTQNWGQDAPAPGCDRDNFQVFMNGYIKAPATGLFEFRFIVNDAFELRVNGKEIRGFWSDSTGAGRTFTSAANQSPKLEAGKVYPIQFWYRDFTKEALFKVQWKYPGSGDFVDIPLSALGQTQDALLGSDTQKFACEVGVGLSPDCPAYSPQEIFDIHGTTTDGEYWLLVAGVATKVQVLMSPAYAGSDGAGYLQLMWIPSGNGGGYTGLSGSGARFGYDSPLWTDQHLTLNAKSGPYDTGKRNTYNYTPVNKLMALFSGAANTSYAANYSVERRNSGVIGDPNSDAFHWVETIPAFAAGKAALFIFDNKVTQSETVIEPVNDRNSSAGLSSSAQSVQRVKISVSPTRKAEILGQLDNRYWFNSNGVRAIQAPKTGVFSAAKNPYNEWYGFNFRGREWDKSKDSMLKMRWGFFSMGYQEPINVLTPEYNSFTDSVVNRDWSQFFTSNIGEQAASSIYQPRACNSGGCGEQLVYSFFGARTRYLAIGGIGLHDSNVAAYQPYNLNLADVQLNGGMSEGRAQCQWANYVAPGVNPYQHQKTYDCSYATGIYGQMPNPSLATVSQVVATEVIGGYNVTWSAVTGATEYVFAHRKTGEPWKATIIQNPTDRSFFVAERGPGTYEFKVTARDYDSPISFNSSRPATTSMEVGVGLGGGDELLLAGEQQIVNLNDILSDSPLVVTGITGSGVVAGLTITVDSASATITSTSALSTYSNRSVLLTTSVTLTTQSPSITLYGTLDGVNDALESLTYEHMDPANPVGSIKVEAFDSGNSSHVFNPNNQHYYRLITASGSINFRDAYCQVKVGTNHANNSGGYDNCQSGGTGRANYNGVPGYLATLTSTTELSWLSQSGILAGLKFATAVDNDASGPSSTYADDDFWIGATDLDKSTGAADGNFRWTNMSPSLESEVLMHSYSGGTGRKDSGISGIQIHQRNSSKYSMTILKTRISGYPTYLFANADSGDNDTVHAYLIEYSDDAGKNPLYKARTIRFALDPELGSEAVRSITSTSAAIDFGINPKNSAGTTEVTYSAISPTGLVTGFARVNPGYTDSPATATATLSGLLPYTTYSYTITLTNEGGVVTRTGTFTTGNGTPESMALSARDVTHNSAVLGAAVRANGSGMTSLQVAYSTNANMSGATSANIDFAGIAGTEAQQATVPVTGLSPETTYYFRTTAINSAGTAVSDILSFTTGKDLSAITQQISSASASAELPNGITITPNHPTVFPADFGRSPAQDATYISYTLKNTSGQEVKDLWLTLEDFTGGSVLPTSGTDEQAFVGSLAAGQSKTIFFFLKALRETELDQSHVVKLNQGQPGTDVASTSSSIVFTFDAVRSVGDSNALVRDVRFNTSAPPLGGEFKVTSTGTFDGSIGNDEFFLTPAVKSDWPAESLRLTNIRLVFPEISSTPSCPAVVINTQLLDNSCYRGEDYEVTYTFRVIDVPGDNLDISPAVISGNGSSWQGNDLAENPPVTPTLRPQQNLTLNTSVSDSATSSQVSINGTTYSEVAFTIDVDNTSLRESALDQILIDLDSLTLVNTESAYLEINGTRYSISPRVIDSSSNLVAIDGPIAAEAGDEVKVVFEALIPQSTAQNITVSGKIGDSEIGPEPGTNSSTKVEVNGSGAISASTTVAPLPPRAATGAASDVFADSAVIRGKLYDGVQGTSLSFRIGNSPDLSFGTWDISASPAASSGLDFEAFGANLTGLTPGTTYYFKPLYNGVPTGEVMSFTTLAEDKPFVGLKTDPLPQIAICTETELACPPTVITPPVVSCGNCSLSYTVSAGSLPPGMTLDPNSGVISGTPTGTGGNYPFTLTVTAGSSDPSESAMTASQNYNLVAAPNTAEPQVLGASVGNVSNTSALISTNLGYVPNGELVRFTVRYLNNGIWETRTTEVVGEGAGQQSQLYTLNLIGLNPSSTYSFKVNFGTKEGDWVEFATTASATVPVAPAVSNTEVSQVDGSTAVLSATVSNPIAGDALGFVVGTQQDLSDAKTYIASNASATTEYAVSTQLSSLAPGTYFYRVLLGDALSPLTYPFTIATSQNGGGSGNGNAPAPSGGTGATASPGTSTESDAATENQYRYVLKRIPVYFAPGKTTLTSTQKREVRLVLANLPKTRVDTKITAVGWVAARPILPSDSRVSTQRARNVIALVPSGFDAEVRAIGKARAKNSSASARRVDLWISYKVPVTTEQD